MQEPTETDVQDNASEVIAKALGKTSGNIELNDTVPISIYESYRETDLFRSVTCELEALDPHDEYSLVTTIFDTTKKNLNRASVTSINSSNGDGAFPASINKYGNIECAGRVGIVSNLLNDNNIQHYVASAAGHVFIIVKYEGGNYSYMDPNNGFMFDFNNLKTSFVRADTGIVTDFTPEDVHNIRGINLPYENFILRNPVEGVNRAFFNNLVSAVDGQPEFQFSVIAPNPELVDKIRAIEAELLPVLSSIELELSSAENQSRNLHERRTGTINDELHIIKRDSSTASEFAEKVLSALDSESLSFPNWMNQQVFTDIKPFLEELYRALP